MSTKVWDVVQPKDNWGRNYAHMEYMRIVDHDLWNATKYIEIYDPYTCMHCGERNSHWQWTCERCDALECIAVDEAQQDG